MSVGVFEMSAGSISVVLVQAWLKGGNRLRAGMLFALTLTVAGEFQGHNT